MYFALSKDSQTLFWASEKWMLQVACGHAGVSLQEPEASEVNQHYSFSFRDLKLVVSRKKVEPKKWQVTYSGGTMGYLNTSKPAKFVDVRVDHIVQDGTQPVQIVMSVVSGSSAKDVLCIPPAADEEEVVSLVKEFFQLHKKVYEGDVTLLVEEDWFFDTPGSKVLRIGTYRLIRQLKEEIKQLNWEIANGNTGQEELPPHAVAEGADGKALSGRALKKALREAGNCCAFCGASNIKRGDLHMVHGSLFLSEKEFVCGECVADGVYTNFAKYN